MKNKSYKNYSFPCCSQHYYFISNQTPIFSDSVNHFEYQKHFPATFEQPSIILKLKICPQGLTVCAQGDFLGRSVKPTSVITTCDLSFFCQN